MIKLKYAKGVEPCEELDIIKERAEGLINDGRKIQNSNGVSLFFTWQDSKEGSKYWNLINELFEVERPDVKLEMTGCAYEWLSNNAPDWVLDQTIWRGDDTTK